MTEEQLVIRAALRDEVSRPLAALRREVKATRSEIAATDLAARRGASRGLSRFGLGLQRINRLAGLTTGALARTAKYGLGIFTLGAGLAATAIYRVGNAYQDSINTFQAVTRAGTKSMAAVSKRAKQLGSDLTLPSTSAADAAAAMTELAKGGLSVRDSMDAALGTLRLATAANISGADAAAIQVAALNDFQLKGRDAARVADLLAATANAASGEVTDMAEALTYVGPVAHAVGINISDTATAVGILAKNNILGSMAGTGLRGMLVRLAKPTKMGRKGIKALGLSAFDAAGNFVGMRKVSEQLHDAQKRLTRQQFLAAAAMTFGQEPLAAVSTLATAGAKGWDAMNKSITKGGDAQVLAAAKSKGLGGAMRGLQSQLETIAIDIWQKVQGPASKAVTWISEHLPGAATAIEGAVGSVISSPVWGQVGAAAQTAAGAVKTAFDTVAPIVSGVFDSIDWTGIYDTVKTKAQLVAQPFIDGISTGLTTGDWGPLGDAISNGVSSTVKGGGKLVSKIFDFVDWAVKHVDWVGLGIQLGTAAAPLALGLLTGFLNGLTSIEMLKGIMKHWFDILIAVIGIVLLPAGIAERISVFLARIPLVGTLLKWLFEATREWGAKGLGYVWQFIRFLGRGFAEGFRMIFPESVGALTRLGEELLSGLLYVGRLAYHDAFALMEGIGRGIFNGMRLVGLGVAQVIRSILDAFLGAGDWLYQAGRDILGGLARGVWDAVTGTIGTVGKAVGAVAKGAKGAASDIIHGRNPFGGDTSRPRAGGGSGGWGATGAAARALESSTPGHRRVTSGLRFHNLGSQGSDHARGRALDLVGSGLNAYARNVRRAGGYAAFHGSGGGRHLHVAMDGAAARNAMPGANGPVGDTSRSRSQATVAGGASVTVNVHPGAVVIQGSGLGPDELADAVADGISRYARDEAERSTLAGVPG